MKIIIILLILTPCISSAEWLETKEGCKAEFPNIVTFNSSAGRKSSWTGICTDGLANGNGVLKVNVGTIFKSVFSGTMKNGQFDGLVRYHWENVTGQVYALRFTAKEVFNAEAYYYEGISLSEEDYLERSTYLQRYQNASTAKELELFLLGTAKYDPQSLAQGVREKLAIARVKELNIPVSLIENEERKLLAVSDLESIFDISEGDKGVTREKKGVPLFLISSQGEVQKYSSKFKIEVKNNSTWRPKYGIYKVKVKFKIKGNISSSMNLLFISRNEVKPFQEAAAPVEFILSSANGWSNTQLVDFDSILSNISLSVFGKNTIDIRMTDLKITYDIISARGL